MFKLFIVVLAALFAVSMAEPEAKPYGVSAYHAPAAYGAYGVAPYPYSAGFASPYAAKVYGGYHGVPYSAYGYY